MDVRVAVDVYVPLGAAEGARLVQQLDAGPGRHVTGRPFEHVSIAGRVEQRRHPQLQIQAGRDEQVGGCGAWSERGLGTDEVRVLVAVADCLCLDPVAADLLGHPRVVGDGGYDLQKGVC